jgi:hypothetical protein
MAGKSFTGNVAELITIARSYLNSRVELWKLSLLEKVSLAGAYFLSAVIVVLIGAFFLLFISLAFAFWYGQTTGNIATGFLITAGFYVVLGIIFLIGRDYLITRPLIRAISSIIFKGDDDDDETEEK